MNGDYERLEDAVLDCVEEFRNENKSFSIWDITSRLRQAVNNGFITIDDCISSSSVFGRDYDIYHNEVRRAFRSEFNAGNISNLSECQSIDGRYMVYSPSVPSQVPTFHSRVSFPQTGNYVPDDEVERRINTYITNCQTQDRKPTLKNVQSAIKRGRHATGYTVSQIQSVIDSLGLSDRVTVKY